MQNDIAIRGRECPPAFYGHGVPGIPTCARTDTRAGILCSAEEKKKTEKETRRAQSMVSYLMEKREKRCANNITRENGPYLFLMLRQREMRGILHNFTTVRYGGVISLERKMLQRDAIRLKRGVRDCE